jgi:UDP:flavonoid glycosyltransferase YjiC (YdhE family)
MRILIVTAGSRGDVAPFTGLGQRLQQAGHHVALAAHERFAGLVQDAGLEHRTLPGDPVELTRARTAAPSPEAAREVFAGFLDELGDGVVAATEAGADIVLTAFGPAPLSRVVAEGFGIPSAGVYLAPGVPTREFPPPGWPAAEQMSPADNLAAGREVLGRTGALYADVLRRLRARLDLRAAAPTPGFRPEPVPESPSRSDSVPESRARPEIAPESRARPEAVPESRARPEAALASQSAEPPDYWPICHGFSPAVVPRPADWPASVQMTGYWWPAPSPGWQPPDQLLDFLRAGPPPVFVGFGSMTPRA